MMMTIEEQVEHHKIIVDRCWAVVVWFECTAVGRRDDVSENGLLGPVCNRFR